ncbi:MAG: transglycosylase domain-containing protein [Bdellovibrionota bacterium]
MKRWKLYIPAITIELVLLLACFVANELKSSQLQAAFFSKITAQSTFTVKPGESDDVRFPQTGPYDIRLGYTRLPALRKGLVHRGYRIASQARLSPRMRQLMDLGLFPPYHEKTHGGLTILDSDDRPFYQVIRPERLFPSFESIPSLIVDTLLYIENREILDPNNPKKNPAVEWDRLGKAVLEKAVQEIYPERSGPGGSTLATQLEKYRHSYEGRTRTAKDKFQQMLSASFRAYLDGQDTTARRKKIVLDYINSIPLAALPGFGEVNGLSDGLFAWYRADIAETAKLLQHAREKMEPEMLQNVARAYKQVLSLFIAHRRPSSFLLSDVQVLNGLTDEHLRLLEKANVITPELSNAAQEIDLHLASSAPPQAEISYTDRKAANAIRTQLLTDLSVPKLYDLDQVDLTVHTSIAREVQDAVTEALRELKNRETAVKFGLAGDRNLDKGDPAKVVYSVTLYEHVGERNVLRVETDNYNKPFNINSGAKLDLGSTAKLRVLTNYLEIVDRLRDKYTGLTPEELKKTTVSDNDPIAQWALGYVKANPSGTLAEMLDAAMDRTYSASTGEAFFTGGGLHHFQNFKKEDNGRTVNLSEAVRNSINLPFIRLMRDIVRHYMADIPGSPTHVDDSFNLEARQAYLARFADKEGTYFLEQFYQKYRKLEPDELLPFFLRNIKPTPIRLAAIYRYLNPDKDIHEFSDFMESWLPLSNISSDTLQGLFEKYGPGKFSLQDQGYIARVHPLELWLVGYLFKHPKAHFDKVREASTAERQEVYAWLFKTKNRHAQDVRIRVLIETEAFLEIHRAWKRMGYPFDSLVPSYATAIGSSGDRPAALAELVGILMNDGVLYPNVRITGLDFAKNTPYETTFRTIGDKPVRLLKSEVAARLRRALMDVVDNGTARRVSKSFKDLDGNFLPIGGKTGTGDHRFETFGKGGQMLSSRVVNRTATFAFFIGTRFFGVVSAHVHGEEAANYDFTSSLAAGLLKALEPSLTPLIHKGLRTGIEEQAEREARNWDSEFEKYREYPLCLNLGDLPLVTQLAAEFGELRRMSAPSKPAAGDQKAAKSPAPKPAAGKDSAGKTGEAAKADPPPKKKDADAVKKADQPPEKKAEQSSEKAEKASNSAATARPSPTPVTKPKETDKKKSGAEPSSAKSPAPEKSTADKKAPEQSAPQTGSDKPAESPQTKPKASPTPKPSSTLKAPTPQPSTAKPEASAVHQPKSSTTVSPTPKATPHPTSGAVKSPEKTTEKKSTESAKTPTPAPTLKDEKKAAPKATPKTTPKATPTAPSTQKPTAATPAPAAGNAPTKAQTSASETSGKKAAQEKPVEKKTDTDSKKPSDAAAQKKATPKAAPKASPTPNAQKTDPSHGPAPDVLPNKII